MQVVLACLQFLVALQTGLQPNPTSAPLFHFLFVASLTYLLILCYEGLNAVHSALGFCVKVQLIPELKPPNMNDCK